MELRKEVIGAGFLCIHVTGHVDALAAPQLEKVIVAALASPGTRCILDFAQVEYMSSAGLRVLLVGAKTAAAVKGAFAICSLQEGVSRVLNAVNFKALIEVYETGNAAVEAIGKRLDGK